MTVTVFALALALAAPADDKKDAKAGDAAAEMKKMEGTWTFEKLVQNGMEPAPADELKEMRLEIKGETRTVKHGDEVRTRSKYKIDPKASPKTIDVEVTEGPRKGMTLYGIYELDGDTFKIALSLQGKDRPAKLDGGEGTVLQVFKRVKGEKKEEKK